MLCAGLHPRIDDDFRDLFLFVSPDGIHPGRIIERDAVGDHVAGVDLALLDPLQQRLHVFVHVGLAHFHGDSFAKRSAEGNLVEQAAVNAGNGKRAAFANGENRLAQHHGPVGFHHQGGLHLVVHTLQLIGVGFEADGVDAGVRTDTAGQVFHGREHADIVFGVVDGDGSERAGHLQAFGNAVDGDDARGAKHEGTGDGELADRAASPDSNDIAFLNLRILRGHVAGGKDVGEEEHFFVGEVALNLQRADVGEGHADILGLTSGVPAHHVRVSEEPGAGVAVGRLHEVSVWVGVVARGPDPLAAELAIAAGDGEGHNDAVAALQVGDAAADFLHDAHEFMAEDVAGFHGGNKPVVEMKVGAADGGACDLQDGIVGIENGGIRNTERFHFSFTHPAHSFHSRTPLSGGIRLAAAQRSAGSPLESWWLGNGFRVGSLFHFSNGPPGTVRLSLGARNLAGLDERFEVAEVLNDGLLRVAAAYRLPPAGQLVHAEFLQDGDVGSSIARGAFEDNFAGVLRVAADGTPGDATAGLVGHDLGVPLDGAVAALHHPVRRFLSSGNDADDLLLPERHSLDVSPQLIQVIRLALNERGAAYPLLAVLIRGRRRIVAVYDDPGAGLEGYRLGIRSFFQSFRHKSLHGCWITARRQASWP